MFVVVIGLQGVIFIDFATFLFAVTTLALARFPKPETSAAGKAVQGSILREAAFGWRYIMARPGLLSLLLFFAGANFVSSIIGAVFTPMVLAFTAPEVMGSILSVAGVGMLVSSILMSVWGGPKRRVLGVVGSGLTQGLCLIGVGWRADPWTIAAFGVAYLFSMPIMDGSSQALWQVKTEPDVQGRVFAVRRMIAWSSLPIAYLLAGPLADNVFEPLMAANGALAGSIGQWLGVGTGRGMGLMFVVFGLLLTVFSALMLLYPRLRNLEEEIPDAIPDRKQEAVLKEAIELQPAN
jgi:hypothetical protein